MHRYVRSLRSAACLALCVAASIAQNVNVVEIRPESTPQDAPKKVEVKVERQVIVNGAEAPVETRVIEIAPQSGRAKSTHGATKAAPLFERVIETILKPDCCDDADDCDDAVDCVGAEECVRVDCTEEPCEGFATIELEDLGENAEFAIAEELSGFDVASSDLVVDLSDLTFEGVNLATADRLSDLAVLVAPSAAAGSSDDCCECTCGKCCMHGKKKSKNVAIQVERTQRSGPEWRSDEVPPTPARGAARSVVIRRAEAAKSAADKARAQADRARAEAEEARGEADKARSAAGEARTRARAEVDRVRGSINREGGARRFVERWMIDSEGAMKQAHESHRKAMEEAEEAMREAQAKFPRALRATRAAKPDVAPNSTEPSDDAEAPKSVTLFGSTEGPMIFRSLRSFPAAGAPTPAAEAPDAPVAPRAPKAAKAPKASKALKAPKAPRTPMPPMPPMSDGPATGGGLGGSFGGVYSTGPGGLYVSTNAGPGMGGDPVATTPVQDDAMHAEIEALRKELHALRAQLHEMRAAGRGSDSPKKR